MFEHTHVFYISVDLLHLPGIHKRLFSLSHHRISSGTTDLISKACFLCHNSVVTATYQKKSTSFPFSTRNFSSLFFPLTRRLLAEVGDLSSPFCRVRIHHQNMITYEPTCTTGHPVLRRTGRVSWISAAAPVTSLHYLWQSLEKYYDSLLPFLKGKPSKLCKAVKETCSRRKHSQHTVRWQILRKMEDLNLDGSHWSFSLAKPSHTASLGATTTSGPLGAAYLPSTTAQSRKLIQNSTLYHWRGRPNN